MKTKIKFEFETENILMAEELMSYIANLEDRYRIKIDDGSFEKEKKK